MKLVNYIDYSKMRIVNGKNYPTSYFMLEFPIGENGDRFYKVLIKPVNNEEYDWLRIHAERRVIGKTDYQDSNKK